MVIFALFLCLPVITAASTTLGPFIPSYVPVWLVHAYAHGVDASL